jgi:hypothetical protein
MTGRALWLADALRAEGLHVVEQPGWQTRGDAVLDPAVVVCHHTASSSNGGDSPSLSIVVNGRSDLPGPLCNVLLARSGTVHVVASGRSNNAGRGSWKGIVGNSRTLGIEAENNGIGEPWPAVQLDAYARICSAFSKAARIPITNVIGHKEWTTRKIDPSFDMGSFRVAVAAHLDQQPAPAPKPPALEEDDMPRALRSKRSGATFVVDPGPKTIWKVDSAEQLQELYMLGLIKPDPGNVPGTVSGEFLDDFRDISG